MLRDVFYYGSKPNVHPREKFATSLEDARKQCTTEHFWIVNEYCDYQNFNWDWDFEFLPDEDVWAEEHNNVWPSQHQKDSGTWLCPSQFSEVIVYRADVDVVKRKYTKSSNWVLLDLIDETKFDFSWHPDPTDSPYIYTWGCKFFPVELQACLEYHAPNATNIKYMSEVIELLPQTERWVEIQEIDKTSFDLSWRPSPLDPPMNYVWGNKHIDGTLKSTLEYHMPDATDTKYMPELISVLPELDKWAIPNNIDRASFDFSWRPDPREPDLIYEFATQWQKTGGPCYVMDGASEIKYLDIQKAKALPNKNNFEILDNNVIDEFDYSWHPDSTDEPYIYVFGNNLYPAEVMPTIQYVPSTVPRLASGIAIGQLKYISDIIAILGENKSNWTISDNIDITNFDFTWIPNPKDPAYIYEFGTQWQKTGGPKYITPGVHNNGVVKYIDTSQVKTLPDRSNWSVLNNLKIKEFDYSWHPDSTEPPYIYHFGNDKFPAEIMPTLEYVVEGATEIKYINDVIAVLDTNMSNWTVPDNLDTTNFDFTWIPNPKDPAYIYEFGTQWQKTGGPQYVVPSASEVKYIDINRVKIYPNKNNFNVLDNLEIADFDYSWHPDSTDEPYIYVFGNSQYPAEIMPTLEYVVEGATEIKYINDVTAVLEKNMTNWVIPDNVDAENFDFTWIPNPKDPAYIYEFGTQWQKTGGPQYVVPSASEVKYVDTQKAIAKASFERSNWAVLNNLKIKEFDYSWHPDATEEPFIYIFGNTQYPGEIMDTIEYRMPNATSIKYVTEVVARLDVDMNGWIVPEGIDISKFDFSWKPNPKDPAFIYQFGTQWQKTGGPRYVVENATEVKYIDTDILKAVKLPIRDNFKIPDDIAVDEFDFSWHPDDTETHYLYQFGTQWQKTGGPTYIVENATETKYIALPKAKKLPSKMYWVNPSQSDVNTFDHSWHPDETVPPYIYQFGTLLNKEDGPRYMSPNTNGEIVHLERVEIVEAIETLETFPKYIVTSTLEELIKEHPNELFWALNPVLDYSEFDFDWRPSIEQAQYVHAFGSSDSEITQTYLVNSTMWEKGFRELNWVVDKKLDDETLFKLFKKSDMFFVDRSNNESTERFEKLKQQFPTIQKTRYLNSWVDTINRCINRSTTELCWILNSELDYTEFNFEYYPNPWQMKMIQVFGTQWSHWGTTFMVNRETFSQDTKYIKIIEHLSNLNFVKDRRAKATNVLYDIVYIDHGNVDTSTLAGNTVIKYQNSYITTFQKLLAILPVKKEHYVWIASTVCDYKEFDFTYICDPFAKEQLHVFPSDRQKFGDTFLVDVNKLRSLIEDMNILEDYEKINYNQSQRAKRLPAPIIITENDTHVSTIDSDFDFPYATFLTIDNKEIQVVDTEPMSLWTPESKNIQITSVGGTRIVVPKEAKEYVKRELYDYPYIITNSKLAKSSPMDIVFLSNGETGAEENYQHLLKITNGLLNRVTRIDGVNGRVQAYHAAAEASNTPWMFTVFAKLKVSNKFDWNWQPDRLQLPKHYVFHASNPVNGLKYGHMAMIAYNKKLTLANTGKGLDFTMDDEHEVVELNSGIANFNTDEWSTWRTAFREALKLRATDDEVSKNRLEFWLTVGSGKFSQYSINGATDAVQYYEEVNGEFEKLKLSYDWPWLYAYFQSKYN